MRQGEIWYANLEPVKGSEQAGNRPIVIVSGPTMNNGLPVVFACPLTSVIKEIKGCIILKKNAMNKLKKDSEVLVFQIRSLSKLRLTKRLGAISQNELQLIKDGINLYLNY